MKIPDKPDKSVNCAGRTDAQKLRSSNKKTALEIGA